MNTIDTPSVHIATMQTSNFTFSGVGTNHQEACRALSKALIAHGKQYSLPSYWWKDHDSTVVQMHLEVGYRDNEAITGSGS